MYQAMYIVHVLSALALIFYILLPFLAGGATNPSTAKALHRANRIGQYVLVLAFLSGGYMVSKAEYSVLWMVLAVVFILVMFAMTGMAGKPLKQLIAGDSSGTALRKLRIFTLIAGVSYVLLLAMMLGPK
ncbi:hypothetical protein [Paenibacillus flagellatus]|uniref:DUF2269 domain-containing protein n=1 Tax=Paenibacillus flagellatus TaxID=2211139 RepID=A0A2V5KBR7_9BACL|nr:hypothetical protein [Paenibacillus flagellatus]PYI56995.1 hypothetical protein DLM86_00675 [Paenibacillus flagellatus]